MNFYRKNIGEVGEQIAVEYLIRRGYKILQRNFRSKFAELDIIVKKNNKISFIEVKTRVGLIKGYPHEAIDNRKVRHLLLAADYFVLKNQLKHYKLSLDLISVVLNEDLSVNRIKYFENIEL